METKMEEESPFMQAITVEENAKYLVPQVEQPMDNVRSPVCPEEQTLHSNNKPPSIWAATAIDQVSTMSSSNARTLNTHSDFKQVHPIETTKYCASKSPSSKSPPSKSSPKPPSKSPLESPSSCNQNEWVKVLLREKQRQRWRRSRLHSLYLC